MRPFDPVTGPDAASPLERIAECRPGAADLFCLCAFLNPTHPVPLSALDEGIDVLPERVASALRDPAVRTAILDALLDAAVGGAAGGELVLDAGAARAAVAGLGDEARRGWAGSAAVLMERVFPGDPGRAETREDAAALYPHAVAAAAHAAEQGVALGAAAQLFYLAGRYLLEVREDFEGARPLLELAAATRERAHGPADARVAFDLSYLNGALLHLGEWRPMAENAVRAAEILEAEYGGRDRTVISHINNAALLLSRAGDHGRAREWFIRALSLAQPVFGEVHPFCATMLSNLGDLSRAEGDLSAAGNHYARSLAIDEACYGPRHDSVARDLAKLGSLLVETGDHAAARAHLGRALAWYSDTASPSDPRTAHVRAALALLDAERARPSPAS